MEKTGATYQVSSIGDIQTLGRVTLKEKLALTGSEISINELPPGASVPFVHSHKRNEEVYIILKGKGQFYLDGDEFDVEEGDVIRVDPAGATEFRGHLTNSGRVLFHAEMRRLSPEGRQRRGHRVREDVFDYPRGHPTTRKTHFVHRRYSA